MHCHEFRKYLYAFADGQIDVKSNCDLLDHLKMCSECSRIVDQHQALKALIVSSANRSHIPPGLEARIRSAITKPAPKATTKRTPGGSGAFANRPMARVLAMAACIVGGFVALWATGIVGPGNNFRSDNAIAGMYDADEADIKMRSVVVQHNKCVERCNEQIHQLPGLPHDRIAAARELSHQLGDHVAIAAPDMTGFGYEFQSAAVCSPSRDIHGATAHVMYVNHAYGTRLSIFSVPQWDAAGDLLAHATLRHPFTYTPRGNCENQTIVAWKGKATTYIVCAPIDETDLAQMMRELAFSLPADAITGE